MASNSNSTKVYPSSGYGYTLSCGFSENTLTEDHISRNVTNITAYGKLQANGTYWSTSYTSSLVLYWHDNKNNTDVEIGSVSFAGFSSTSDSRSVNINFDIEHNSDGTLSGYVWVQFNKGSTTSAYAPASGSVATGWTNLTTIPRATKITSKTGTIGTAMSIAWTKSSSAFTHKLTYKFSTETGTIGTNLVDGVEWTPPDSFYELIKSAQKGEGILYLTTYNGSTQIGDTQEATLTIYPDEEESKAVIEEKSIRDENSITKALTGDLSVLILQNSLAFITLVFNTRKYATAKSVTVNGIAMEISEGTLQSDKTTTQYVVQQDVGKATSATFKIVITDSRDLVTEETITAEVINYIPLDCNAKIQRISPTTGEIGLTFEGKYFNSSFGEVNNSLKISYVYKKKLETDYSSEIVLTQDANYKILNNTYFSGTGNSSSEITLAQLMDYREEYNVVLYVEDELSKIIVNLDIIKGIPIIWWNGIAFHVNGDVYIADENGENATLVFTTIEIDETETTETE